MFKMWFSLPLQNKEMFLKPFPKVRFNFACDKMTPRHDLKTFLKTLFKSFLKCYT